MADGRAFKRDNTYGAGPGVTLDPRDLVGAALYFLSEESAQVTGQVLEVDGGWSVTETSP